MEYASTELIHEHESILDSLKVLDVISNRLESGKDIPVEDIKAPIEFFKIFVDRYHHCKEECILYPAMAESGVHNQNGPIGMMLYEHDKGREYLLQMEDSISVSPIKKDKFIKSARGYTALLRHNIMNENSVLLPIADIKIPPSKQENIIKAFKEHEENVIGKETHEKLNELLYDLKRKYLM
ncbi:MAG TPA: hemerythrin domain-containing protein [Spirochaetota bacterium]|nr:hemerythrin domain-containing protein [Spirochaetota bacterium]